MGITCYEMKKGQKLLCKGCGFEMQVTEECDQTCKKDGCCDVTEILCCGKPMTIE
jgi:hypothetical protein